MVVDDDDLLSLVCDEAVDGGIGDVAELEEDDEVELEEEDEDELEEDDEDELELEDVDILK